MIAKGKTNDQELKRVLLDAQKDLYDGRLGVELLKALKSNFPMADSAYVLQWIPEQGEDIFWILINPSIIGVIEVPRAGNQFTTESTVRVMGIDDYLKRKLTSETKRKLALAINLQTQ